MFLTGSERLASENPEHRDQIEAVDHWLQKAVATGNEARFALSFVSSAADLQPDDALRVLRGLIDEGELHKRFVTVCPNTAAYLDVFESKDAIPDSFECENCPEPHEILKAPSTVMVIYTCPPREPSRPLVEGAPRPSAPPSRFDRKIDSAKYDETHTVCFPKKVSSGTPKSNETDPVASPGQNVAQHVTVNVGGADGGKKRDPVVTAALIAAVAAILVALIGGYFSQRKPTAEPSATVNVPAPSPDAGPTPAPVAPPLAVEVKKKAPHRAPEAALEDFVGLVIDDQDHGIELADVFVNGLPKLTTSTSGHYTVQLPHNTRIANVRAQEEGHRTSEDKLTVDPVTHTIEKIALIRKVFPNDRRVPSSP